MNIYELIDKMTLEHKTIFDMSLRVTFYARVSTHRDEQLNSQENQIQTFTEMIENNKNWTFVDGYIDTIRGESAAIVFVPKFGDELNATVNRQNSDMSIGNITKKILPILTLRLKRFSVSHFSKKEYKDIEYHLKLQI